MSDKPKHTPGPWTVQLSHQQNDFSHFIEADAKPGHSIACLEKHGVRGQPASAEECANARLIAAGTAGGVQIATRKTSVQNWVRKSEMRGRNGHRRHLQSRIQIAETRYGASAANDPAALMRQIEREEPCNR